MPIVTRGMADLSKIDAGVRRAQRALRPQVVRIMHTLGVDWRDEEALFFRVVLCDAASSPKHLRDTTQRASEKILSETQAESMGLQCYFNFRSETEQAVLREPEWEA